MTWNLNSFSPPFEEASRALDGRLSGGELASDPDSGGVSGYKLKIQQIRHTFIKYREYNQ